VEDRKLYVDKSSVRFVARIHGVQHTLVPFAAKDGGRLGAHALFFLHSLAERALGQGRRSKPASRDLNGDVCRIDGATHVSLCKGAKPQIFMVACHLVHAST